MEIVESPAGPLAFAVDKRRVLVVLKFAEGEYERTIEQDLEHEGFEIEEDLSRTARVREELLSTAQENDGPSTCRSPSPAPSGRGPCGKR